MELFVHFSLKIVQTLFSTFPEIFLLITKHKKEIFQNLRQVSQQINSDNFVKIGDPLDEELPDTWAHRLNLDLDNPHEFFDVKFLVNDLRRRTESRVQNCLEGFV
jgi:hypothetical protein